MTHDELLQQHIVFLQPRHPMLDHQPKGALDEVVGGDSDREHPLLGASEDGEENGHSNFHFPKVQCSEQSSS